MFWSTSLRQSAVFTAGFSLAVMMLGMVTVLSTRANLAAQFQARIEADMVNLQGDYRREGLDGALDEVGEHRQRPGDIFYGLQKAGRPVAGELANVAPPPLGWSNIRLQGGARARNIRALAQDIGGGYRAIIGDDWDRVETLQAAMVRDFALAFAGLLVIGVLGGLAFSRTIDRRLAAISGTAEAIIDGDLSRRIPVKGGDDLARLALTINRMLDRIGGLMDSLRQASNDVAHDLRTPLTRLRQRLEYSARKAEDPAHRHEIEGALRDVDFILATFAALLRIAEIDAGSRRAAFRRLNLAALARTLVDDFAPAAEDAGQALTFEGPRAVWIEGDASLITQMGVNLVENALRHTPRGSHIRVKAALAQGGVVLCVEDDGPGVPAADRERVFDRFYRLERSRSTPGNGLGLALVAAVARLHRAEVGLSDAGPGLRVQAVFPALAERPTEITADSIAAT